MNDELSVVIDPMGWPMRGLINPQWHLNRMKLVARSAGSLLWKHCEVRPLPQIVVYPRKDWPHCDFELDSKGRIRIGLHTSLNSYAQQAYQFAHEFCHTIANHSREGQRHDARHANHWLEESFCEAASLFALRRMTEEWQAHKEFAAWTTADKKPYAPSLLAYAQDQINKANALLPLDQDFRTWFESQEQFMRGHPVAIEKDKKTKDALRENYTAIASRLLPLLEARHENWEALSYLNLTPHGDNKPLAEHLADWKVACPERLKPFIEDLERLFLPSVTKVQDAA